MSRRRRAIAEINVVPYVDVMLVLLVVFMITTPLLTRGVKIDLPKAHTAALDTKQVQPIIVTVDKKGQYYLNISDKPRRAMTQAAIVTRVAAQLQLSRAAQQSPQVLVKGDSHVDYGAVVQAMALLQAAGADKVGLMTAPYAQARQA